MKLLITGGAGFMGSNFIRYLLAKYPDYEIINLDKLTYAGNLANLKDIEGNPSYRFIQADIQDREVVSKLTSEVDAVINYAAETHVDRSIADPESFLRTDVIGTYSLLEAARETGLGRFIQISTDEVYGSSEDGEFVETSPFQPNSPYSASKASGDLLCRAYVQTYDLPVIVTHSCNFYGPFQYPEKLIPLFITNLIEGKKLPLYADGTNVREWIYTEDHCQAIDLILHKGQVGEVYNIGSGERLNNLEITGLILDVMGYDESMIEYVKDRPGHDFRYAIDCSKLADQLGFEPAYQLEDALRRTIDWYAQNEWWWRPLKDSADEFVNK